MLPGRYCPDRHRVGVRVPGGTVAPASSRPASVSGTPVYSAAMHKEDSLRVGRIVRVLNEFVRPARRGRTEGLEVAAYHVHGEPVPAAGAFAAEYAPFAVGDPWGPAWDTTWFRLRGTIPEAWSGREVHLGFAIGNAGETGFGAEALLFRHGEPVQGLSPNHRSVLISERAHGGEDVELFVEAAANPPSPFGANPWPLLMAEPHGDPLFTLAKADLHTVDPVFEAFFHDFRVAVEAPPELPDTEPASSPAAGRPRAGLRSPRPAGHPLVVARRGTPGARPPRRSGRPRHPPGQRGGPRPPGHRLAVAAPGDRAQVRPDLLHGAGLMDRYPEYHFVVSQAQHLAWMRDHYPGLCSTASRSASPRAGSNPPAACGWRRTATSPRASRWCARSSTGSASTSTSSACETDDVWLPDVFGYSAALPQIMQLGGVAPVPHPEAVVEPVQRHAPPQLLLGGHRRARVFTHFPPADTYGGQMSVHELRYGVSNFRDHEHSNRSLYPFGHGDGGGGPTAGMLESARRLADSEGVPSSTMEGPRRFFDQTEAEIGDPAVWAGELYLEHHRGTYTTQGATKQDNRRGELALRDAELWSALVDGDAPDRGPPRGVADLLLHQFHDIIPGSGIHWVYEDTRRPTPRCGATPRRSPPARWPR